MSKGQRTVRLPKDYSQAAFMNIVRDLEGRIANLEALGPIDQSFTPTLGDGTNNFTLSVATGAFTKYGRVIHFGLQCTWSSIGSAGAAQLRALLPIPYTAMRSGAFSFCQVDGVDTVGGANDIYGFVSATTATVFFRTGSDNANSVALAANSCSPTGQINGSGFFFI